MPVEIDESIVTNNDTVVRDPHGKADVKITKSELSDNKTIVDATNDNKTSNPSVTSVQPKKNQLLDWTDYRTKVAIGVTVAVLVGLGSIAWSHFHNPSHKNPTTKNTVQQSQGS